MNGRLHIHAVILFALLALVGCGGGDDNQPASPPPSAPPPTPPLVTGQPGKFDGPVTRIIATDDGSADVYVTGSFTRYNDQPVRPLVRLKPDGSLNQTFMLDNAIVAGGADIATDGITAIAVADDGTHDLYVGEFLLGGVNRVGTGRLWRVDQKGTAKPSFQRGDMGWASGANVGGPSILPMRLHAVVPVGDGSGRVYVGGAFDQYNGLTVANLVRVNPNGSLDSSFAYSFVAVSIIAPAKDNTGDIYVVRFNQVSPSGFRSQHVYRINSDGTQDPAFDEGPGISANVQFNSDINTLVPVEDGSGDIFLGGSFVVWGDFNHFGPNAVPGLARVNPDGTLDKTEPTPQIPDSGVSAIAKAVDGSGDWFVASSLVGRYKPDGRPDPSFIVGQVRAIVLLPLADGTGDLYVGGSFSSYNGVNVGSIVRLNANGTLD